MKIHEYQGKELLRQFNVPVPNGTPAFSVDEAIKAAKNWAAQCGLSKHKFMRVDAVKAVV